MTGLCGPPAYADQESWTEKKLGKIILKADKAARQKKWPRAIKYGELMLLASEVLDKQTDARYINLLKNLNRYYDKAGRLDEIALRLEKAYMLSGKHLGPDHETSKTSHHLYYKFFISQKKYPEAISLVKEGLSVMEESDKNNLRLHHYQEQLAALYGLTRQYQKEEAALLRLLETHIRIFGRDNKEYIDSIIMLAQNYCHQKKFEKFNRLIKANNQKYKC